MPLAAASGASSRPQSHGAPQFSGRLGVHAPELGRAPCAGGLMRVDLTLSVSAATCEVVRAYDPETDMAGRFVVFRGSLDECLAWMGEKLRLFLASV